MFIKKALIQKYPDFFSFITTTKYNRLKRKKTNKQNKKKYVKKVLFSFQMPGAPLYQ